VTAPIPQAGPAPEPPLAAGLARFARGLRATDITPAAAGHVTTLTLDAVGCALAGWDAEETPTVLAAARRLGGPPGLVIPPSSGTTAPHRHSPRSWRTPT
jgi:2-methylcitrate dehydratase PrpD